MTFGAGFGFPRARFPMGAAPTLNMDFAGTAALPPYVTFSRGTNATYVDSLGNIAYAPSNLLTYSEQFDNAAWGKSSATISANAALAPNGTTTSDVLIADSTNGEHFADQTITVVAGNTYTLSAYLKASGLTVVGLRLTVGSLWPSTASPQVRFSLLDGTATIISGAPSTYSITAVGGGWYRCSMSAVCVASGTPGARVQLMSGAGNAFTGNGVDGIAIWGAQLNLDGLQPYNSTTVKNLLGYTQDFDNAAWTKSNSFIQTNLLTYSEIVTSSTGAEVTPDAAVAPDGALTMDLVTETATTGEHYPTDRFFIPVVGTTYTWSVYAKQGSGTRTLMLRLAAVNVGSIIFDLVAGTANGTSSGTIFNASITPVGNDIFRCTVVWTATTASTTVIRTQLINVGTVYTGDGTSGIYIWGAQLVQGATPGDYQATTTAALAVQYRAPDGSLTADKLVEDTAAGAHSVNITTISGLVSGTPNTYSVYAKVAEVGRFLVIALGGTAFPSAQTVGFTLSGAGSYAILGGTSTASVVFINDGWYRCSVTALAQASGTGLVVNYLSTSGTSGGGLTYTGDGTSGIYIWGAQLSDSASLDPYSYNFTTAPTAAAYYGPRFDYDPVTLACKGLLIEEQRTNSIRNNTMQGAVAGSPGTVPTNWVVSGTGSGVTREIVAIGSESGIQYIDVRFYGTPTVTSNVSVNFELPNGIAAASGQTWTGSTYIRLANGLLSGAACTLSLLETNGTSGVVDNSKIISPVAGGLSASRDLYTATLSGGVATTNIQPRIRIGFVINVPLDITLRIGLPQLELGAFATSVIPTTTAAVTRAADVAVIQGANFSNWYNQSEGTLFAEADVFNTAANRGVFSASDGTSGNELFHYVTGSAANLVTTGGVFQANSFLSSIISAGVTFKDAFGYKANDIQAAANGLLASTDTLAAIPVTNQLRLGARGEGSFPLNGHIARIAYYPTRQPDPTLQAITT